ncbi:phosphonoacetaldehyde reductase [Hungatella hathewayi]|uniref:phosphonoacetaldehyde reductase n=1 Tax=Hungatella hathewayi TaxID=154046 RepID=UPI003563B3CF
MQLTDFCRTDIRFMDMEEVKLFLLSLKFKKAVLVMSESACKRFQWETFIEVLKKKSNLLRIDENVGYPTQETLVKGLDAVKGFQADVIIAVGGGSSIDFAKGLKAFWHEGAEYDVETVTESLRNKCYQGSGDIRLIAVPTTAGTGAELTKWSTIWDYRGECKYSIEKEELKPDLAIIVPEFMRKAGYELSVTTGLDSLSHAVEAYWSKKSNPLVRELAKQSAVLTVKYLPLLLSRPNDLVYREKQCLAAVLSGLAFSVTRTTACHSLSYPLTMDFHIPHGIAAVLTLAETARKNSGTYEDEEELMEVFKEYGGISGFLGSACFHKTSFRLRDYGVSSEDINAIAGKSFTIGRMDNNPAVLSRQDVEEILKRIF